MVVITDVSDEPSAEPKHKEKINCLY